MPKKYTAKDGTTFTDADIERWAQEAEEGFPDATFGSVVRGRPVTVGMDAKPFTLRLDTQRRTKLYEVARQRHTTASEIVRGLIDSL